MSGTILCSVAVILNGLQKISFNSANASLENQFSFSFPSVRKNLEYKSSWHAYLY